jgi:septum site-determining protein MinD
MLAIAGGKGGVGKTTTSLALAGTLARHGRPVRVVDADCDMPNLHTIANCDRTPTLADVLTGGPPPEQRVPSLPGVRVVAAPPPGAKSSVADALAALDACDRRRTIVDTPAGAGPDAISPLRAVDDVLLVTDATPQSMRDAAKTAAMVDRLDAELVGVVVTGTSDAPVGTAEFLGSPVLAAVPAASEPLSDAAVWEAYDRAARGLHMQSVI